MKQAIEITTFKLVRGKTFDDFVAANVDVDAWLLKQDGFKSRRIAESPGGEVVDMLIWSSAHTARRAMQALMTELADSPVHSVIDQRTVTWTVSTVGHTLEASPR